MNTMQTWQRELWSRVQCLLILHRLITIVLSFSIALTYGTLLTFNPSFHMQNFYIPALNKFTNTTSDSFVFFDLMIHNNMYHAGVRYEAMNLSFSYSANASSSMAFGAYTVPSFYQGMNKTAQRRAVVVVTSTLPWKEAAMEDISGGPSTSTAEFMVDLETHVKFKNWFWYFKHKKITARCGIRVDDSGKKVEMEPVELKSSEPPPSGLLVFFWAAGFLILIVACLALSAFVITPLFFPLCMSDPRTEQLF